MLMPRFDLMRHAIDRLRVQHSKDLQFLKAVHASVYGNGYYAKHANNYAKTLLNNEE